MTSRARQNFTALMVPPTGELRVLLRTNKSLGVDAKLIVAIGINDSELSSTSLWKHPLGTQAPEGRTPNYRATGLAQQAGLSPKLLLGSHIFLFSNTLRKDDSTRVPSQVRDCIDAGWSVSYARSFDGWMDTPAWPSSADW